MKRSNRGLLCCAGTLALALAIPVLGQQQENAGKPAPLSPEGLAGKPVQAPSPQTNKQVVAKQELRDPFWPVGYMKSVEQPPTTGDGGGTVKQPPAGYVNWPTLNLKATMKTPAGKFVAKIEDVGVVESGEIVSLKKEGMIYRYKITAVSDKGVSCQRLDACPAR
jgi:hypothetical protein